MANIALDEFFIEIAPSCPFCPAAVMRRAIINTIRTMSEWAEIWKYEVPPMSQQQGVNTYPFSLPDDTELVRVSYMSIGDRATGQDTEIKGKDKGWLDLNRTGWRSATTPLGGEYFTQDGFDTFTLVPYLSTTGTAQDINMTLVIEPAYTASEVDEQLMAYSEIIGQGAKAKLQAMPKVKWSNSKSAGDNAEAFRYGLRDSANVAKKSFTTSDLQARPMFKFAG